MSKRRTKSIKHIFKYYLWTPILHYRVFKLVLLWLQEIKSKNTRCRVVHNITIILSMNDFVSLMNCTNKISIFVFWKYSLYVIPFRFTTFKWRYFLLNLNFHCWMIFLQTKLFAGRLVVVLCNVIIHYVRLS